MAIDIIARGLATSLLGSDGRVSSDKMPVISGVLGTEGFTPIGNLTDPSQIEGKTVEEILLMMLFGAVNPTFTSPDLTIELASEATAIVGRQTSISGKLIFNRGAITPPYGTSGFRAGVPIAFSVGNEELIATGIEQSFVIQLIPTVGNNEILCSISFEEGEQPLNSIGQPYDAPYPAGAITKPIVIKGIYQLYDKNGNELEFTYFSDETGEGYQSVMASEGLGAKQSFSVAQGVTVVGIKQFDIMTQSWAWIGGSAEASLETFDTTTLEGEILGEHIDYQVYIHNGSARSERELRIYVVNE